MKTSKRLRYNVGLLKSVPGRSEDERNIVRQVQQSFRDTITISLQPNEPTQSSRAETVEEKWSIIRDAVVGAGKQHLGTVRRSNPDWFTAGQATIAPLLKKRTITDVALRVT